ncbi:MAG: hypothetical protein MJ141_08195, partial [Clostridia bacterium]|nr:hypothetical protein [Clostridia bacterium]
MNKSAFCADKGTNPFSFRLITKGAGVKGVRGRIMMYTGFSIFSILFSVVSLFIVGCVIAVFVSVLRERHKNSQLPRLTVEAKTVSRRESHSSSMTQPTHTMD